jgi:hypothetical protein
MHGDTGTNEVGEVVELSANQVLGLAPRLAHEGFLIGRKRLDRPCVRSYEAAMRERIGAESIVSAIARCCCCARGQALSLRVVGIAIGEFSVAVVGPHRLDRPATAYHKSVWPSRVPAVDWPVDRPKAENTSL